MINLENCLLLSLILFCIGLIGLLTRRNIIIILICIELMLNAANIALVGFCVFTNWVSGQAIVLIVIAMSVCEIAVGFALIVSAFSKKFSVDVDDFDTMKS